MSLQRLVERAEVELRRRGKDLVGCCLSHEDRTPSLVISPAKNLWHCLGACQAGGSVIDWTMRVEGVSFQHAVELLRDGVAPSQVAAGGRRPVRISTVTKLPSPLERTADDRELLERVVSFYAQALKESPDALGYLERRGLVHAEVIDTFRLGFSNRTLGYRPIFAPPPARTLARANLDRGGRRKHRRVRADHCPGSVGAAAAARLCRKTSHPLHCWLAAVVRAIAFIVEPAGVPLLLRRHLDHAGCRVVARAA